MKKHFTEEKGVGFRRQDDASMKAIPSCKEGVSGPRCNAWKARVTGLINSMCKAGTAMRQEFTVSHGKEGACLSRRSFFEVALAIGCGWLPSEKLLADDESQAMANWMARWMYSKSLFGRLNLSRFVEPVYFLTQATEWRSSGQSAQYRDVRVPKGFVTDFASIPRVFWSALRPDGEYAHAAVVHDYLYWTQKRSREEADSIFKMAMEDLEVDPRTVFILYSAVRAHGESAWDNNARRKSVGERRVLIKFPEEANARWEEWRTKPGVFGEE